jgi:hypothetical protein
MTLEEKISQLGDGAPAIPRLNIQEYHWWNECLHGVARAGTATVFPQAIGMAASFDTNTMRQVANIISDEDRAKHHEALRNKNYNIYTGLTFWSPNINIFRDPRWGRGHETYGEDPYLTGQMGMEFVKGLQGNDPKYFKVVATGVLGLRINLPVLTVHVSEVGEALHSSLNYSKDSLFLRGDKSEYISPQDEALISTQFPNSSVQTITNAGHWLHAENPFEFYESVRSFIA